jgi:hypothetical protein
MNLPTSEEINPNGAFLDGCEAERHFFGKTQEEAYEMFRESFEYYQEDLMWMGPVGFRFYVEPAIRFIQSEAAMGNFSVQLYFATVIGFRLKHGGQDDLLPVASRLGSACDFIIEHWTEFDVLVQSGDHRDRYRELRLRLLALEKRTPSG